MCQYKYGHYGEKFVLLTDVAKYLADKEPTDQSIYQTNGLCHDFCFDDYAYAITQDEGCWCSNYTPDESVQEDDDECSTTCPAFPEEHCGGPDAFAYLELGLVAPSGTKGASPSATSSAEVSLSILLFF